MSSSASVEHQAAPQGKAPNGWSADAKRMRYNYYWKGDDSIKAMLATSYGLKNAEPLITRNPEYGDILFIFEAPAGKYYVWNGIEGSVCQIVKPTNLNDIYKRINEDKEGGLGGLAMKELK